MARVDCELITLRCSPFSPANRQWPAKCWAAVREFSEVIRLVAGRAPAFIIVENTRGTKRGPCAACTPTCYDTLGIMEGRSYLRGKPHSDYPDQPICRAPACAKAGGHS